MTYHSARWTQLCAHIWSDNLQHFYRQDRWERRDRQDKRDIQERTTHWHLHVIFFKHLWRALFCNFRYVSSNTLIISPIKTSRRRYINLHPHRQLHFMRFIPLNADTVIPSSPPTRARLGRRETKTVFSAQSFNSTATCTRCGSLLFVNLKYTLYVHCAAI